MLSFDVGAFVAAVNDIPTKDVSSSSPTTAALAEPVRDELVEELRKAVKDLQDENEELRRLNWEIVEAVVARNEELARGNVRCPTCGQVRAPAGCRPVSTLPEQSPLADCLALIPIAQAPLIPIQVPPSGEDGPVVQLMLVTVPPGVRAGEQICVSAHGRLCIVTVPGDLGPGKQFQIAIRCDQTAAAQAGEAAAPRLPGIGRLGQSELHETAEEAAAREAAAVQETAAQEAAAAEEAAAQEAAAAEEAAAQEAASAAREAVLAERKKKQALAE